MKYEGLNVKKSDIDESAYEVSDELYKSALDDYNKWLNNYIANHSGLWAMSGYDVNKLESMMGSNASRDTFRQLKANLAQQKADYESKLKKSEELKANNRTISNAANELKNVQYAGDSLTDAKSQLAQAKSDYYDYVNATTKELNQLQYDRGQYVGSKKDAIEDRINEIQSERNKLFNAYNTVVNSGNNNGLTNQQTLADQALKSEAISNQATAISDKKRNISAGIDKNKAGLLGEQEANTTTNGEATQAFTQNQSNQGQTQADWLKAQGAVTAAQNQATLAGKAIPNASIAGALTGAGTGAAMGATISDENEKEPISSTDKLLEMAEQFVELYNQLKELKEKKKCMEQ